MNVKEERKRDTQKEKQREMGTGHAIRRRDYFEMQKGPSIAKLIVKATLPMMICRDLRASEFITASAKASYRPRVIDVRSLAFKCY